MIFYIFLMIVQLLNPYDELYVFPNFLDIDVLSKVLFSTTTENMA